MPASSLFAEMERPTSTPNNLQNSISSGTNPMDDNVALQIALELSKIQFSNDSNSAPSSEPDYGIPGLVDAERAKKSQNMTECVAVPSSEHVAEIVGRQGCKIKALRAKTNTYIKTPVRGEEPVFVVTGRKEDVGSAKREILSAAEHFSQIRACRKNNLNGSMAPGPPTNVPGQVTIQVRVPYRVVGLVVGPKGATIKRIQQTTHTYIVTPSRDKEPVFEVTGLPESVDQARKEIEAHIAMRTGGALDGDNVDPTGVSNRHDMVPHSLNNLFSNTTSDLSSLYKMNSSALNGFSNMGLNGLHGSSTLNSLNGLNNLTNGLTRSMSPSELNTLNSMLDNNIMFGFKNSNGSLGTLNDFQGSNDMNSSLLNSKMSDNSLFSIGASQSMNTMNTNNKMGDMGVTGMSNGFYGNVDEGLGSLGSSMGSSPSFDPPPSSIWGDLGRSLGPTLASNNVNSNGSLSSNMSSLSLTRRSSSVSGNSPPSSRISPTFENHPPARRISSDPASGAMSAHSSSGSSPASTPELGAFASSAYCLQTSHNNDSCNLEGNSNSSSPTPSGGEKRCRACSDAPVVAALVPCGHNLFCMDCAKKMVSEGSKCTICFENVTQAIRIYS